MTNRSQWTKGIDAAAPQGPHFNWDLVAAAGEAWAVCKATEGEGYVDPTYYRNDAEAARVGLLKGGYVFARNQGSAKAQARHAHETIGWVSHRDLPTVLDYEPKAESLSSKAHCNWIDEFCDEYERLSGRQVTIYTGAFILGDYKHPDVGARPLWLAQYTPEIRWLPKQWERATKWQYSGDHGERLPGIPFAVDRDWFLGDRAALDQFIASSVLHREPVYPLETTRGLQRVLYQLGYDPRGIDNRFGPNTRAALETFQAACGIAATGTLTSVTRDELNRALRLLDVDQTATFDTSWIKPLEIAEAISARRFISETLGYEIANDGMCAGVCDEAA